MSQEQQQIKELKKALYLPVISEIVEGWAIGKPPLASTGKPSGYYRLSNYLLEYLLDEGSFPTGIHAMPEGLDRHNNIEPSFPVDFDQIIGERTLPELVGQ